MHWSDTDTDTDGGADLVLTTHLFVLVNWDKLGLFALVSCHDLD